MPTMNGELDWLIERRRAQVSEALKQIPALALKAQPLKDLRRREAVEVIAKADGLEITARKLKEER